MPSGNVARGKDCAANYPPSTQQWKTLRLVYDQAGTAPVAYVPPTFFTDMIRDSVCPYEDPGFATVAAWGIATVADVGPGTPQVNPAQQDLGEDGSALAPLVTADPATASLRPASRGLASPQYRVEFNSGDGVKAVVFMDGGCVLSLPARTVSISALHQELLAPVSDGDIVPATPIGDLLTQVLISAQIGWSKYGGSGAPQGMATFSMIGETAARSPLIFARPPFSRRVQLTPPARVAGVWEFITTMPGGTLITPPPAAVIAQTKLDLPHACIGVQFTPTLAPAAEQLATVVWEIGVR